MWRVSAPPPGFARTVRRLQVERFSENTIVYAYEFFDPLPRYVPWIIGGFVVLVAAVSGIVAAATRGKGRVIALGMVGAAALVEVVLTRAGGALAYRLQGGPGPSLPGDAAQMGGLLLAIFVVVPALLIVAIRWNVRRNGGADDERAPHP
jgi:hypothetical protein